MKVNRQELLKILDAAKPGLAAKEIIQQQVHFIFTGEAVTTYNDKICIIYPYKTDFKFSVQGDEFYKVLDGISDAEVEIVQDDKQIKINSKKTKAGLSTLLEENEKVEKLIAKLQKITSEKRFFRVLPEDFIDGMFLCMFTASKDMTTGVNCCVGVRKNEVLSTDKLRLSRYEMKSEIKEEMLIPGQEVMELVKYKVTKYGLSDGWVHFLTDDGVMFNCRTMAGVYPFDRISSYFKQRKDAVTLPDELRGVMQNAIVMASGDVDIAKMVEVTIDNGKITCRSEKERGWMEKTVDFDYKGKKMHFFVNPIFMAQILVSATSLSLLQGGEYPDKAQFSNKSFMHLIALPT